MCYKIITILVIPKLHLGVEGVELQLVGALEGLGVDLLKGDPVELALKDVDLLHVVILTSYEVPLPGQGQLCVFRSLNQSRFETKREIKRKRPNL